jgi:hypothetical protein
MDDHLDAALIGDLQHAIVEPLVKHFKTQPESGESGKALRKSVPLAGTDTLKLLQGSHKPESTTPLPSPLKIVLLTRCLERDPNPEVDAP